MKNERQYEKLDQVADLLVEVARDLSTRDKSASNAGGGGDDPLTTMQLALYMNVRKSQFIDALRGL